MLQACTQGQQPLLTLLEGGKTGDGSFGGFHNRASFLAPSIFIVFKACRYWMERRLQL